MPLQANLCSTQLKTAVNHMPSIYAVVLEVHKAGTSFYAGTEPKVAAPEDARNVAFSI